MIPIGAIMSGVGGGFEGAGDAVNEFLRSMPNKQGIAGQLMAQQQPQMMAQQQPQMMQAPQVQVGLKGGPLSGGGGQALPGQYRGTVSNPTNPEYAQQESLGLNLGGRGINPSEYGSFNW